MTVIPYQIHGYEVVEQDALPAELANHVGWFLIANRHLRSMPGADMQCGFATTQFLNNLLAVGYIKMDELGDRFYNDEAAILRGMDHRVARVDEWLIDFTARQYSVAAPWPLIWRKM